MTLRQLVSKISKLEGKKHQASVGDIRELLKIFFDIAFVDDSFSDLFNDEMDKRYLKIKKAKKK